MTLAPPSGALPDHAGPPDALMRQGADDAAGLRDMLADPRVNALCIGPGCGVERAAALLPAILGAGRATVLDADALTALSRDPGLMALLHKDCVLTPHAGEFGRVFPDLAARLDHPRPPAAEAAEPASWRATRPG
ncbi:NAD(P)H-hydrate dehydratase, partial [Paracoccus thiocyanatus]|uniref:NAD(P)H-hydrate dehydratase n=1 Tax=Paracoccus thiocyanatus TaxID=34006 RepID=UPI002868AC2C